MYDVTELKESDFLDLGPSALMLQKILNSHIPAVDNMGFHGEKNKYGTVRFAQDDGYLPAIPSVETIRNTLHL
jgi:hypothetical protein